MASPIVSRLAAVAFALVCSSPVTAQDARDPVTRFLDGFFRTESAPTKTIRPEPASPLTKPDPAKLPGPSTARVAPPIAGRATDRERGAPSPQTSRTQVSRPTPRKPVDPAVANRSPSTPVVEAPLRRTEPTLAPQPAPSGNAQSPRSAARKPGVSALASEPTNGKPAVSAASLEPTNGKPVTAAAEPVQPVAAVPQMATPTRAVPSSPAAAIDRVNGYFNTIEQLTASFVQTGAGGQALSGTLALRRPGQLRFAYAAPSTLEVVSDGTSVAVRDKKLGTNDVYPVGQTPLKFLLKDDFNLGRDTKVGDVQIAADGNVTVKFEDSTTFGGTSKVSLRFDARAGRLKGWTVLDPQGFETTVTLSDVNVVPRIRAGN
jgi:outer membrane lipoprotein-sorting protein